MQAIAREKNNGIKEQTKLKTHFEANILVKLDKKAKDRYFKLKKLSFSFLFNINMLRMLATPRQSAIPQTRDKIPK